jgi:protein-S-isoprenylcysteine O-methyltransferase Ste14
MTPADFLARWRVRLGYPLAVIALALARPSLKSILLGAVLGAIGLFIRARAAGHLHKQQVLTITGPYAYTRNPLYLGSFILTVAAAVAIRSWIAAIILCGYFALVYSVVMLREERELYSHHGAAFEEYARAVPLFLPRLSPSRIAAAAPGAFAVAQYKRNREYRAAIGFLLLLLVLLVIWRLRSL